MSGRLKSLRAIFLKIVLPFAGRKRRLRLEKMGHNLTARASGKSALRPKDRVWGFSSEHRFYPLGSRRQRPELRSKPCLTLTIFAPGIPQWPSRDPIGEGGGLNIYEFLGDDPVNGTDVFGCAKITITLERQKRDVFGIYGKLYITASKDVKDCCTMLDEFLTIELPPHAKKAKYKRNDKGKEFVGFYTGLFNGTSGVANLQENSTTSLANIASLNLDNLPGRLTPAGFSPKEIEEMLSVGVNTGNGMINIHMGQTSNWSGGCILIGFKYTAQTMTLDPKDEFESLDSSKVYQNVPGFDHDDTLDAQAHLTSMLFCAKRRFGSALEIEFKRIGPAIPPMADNPINAVGVAPEPPSPPSQPTSQGGFWESIGGLFKF